MKNYYQIVEAIVILYAFIFPLIHGKFVQISQLPNGKMILILKNGEIGYLSSIDSSNWDFFKIEKSRWTAISGDADSKNLIVSSADNGISLSHDSGKSWSQSSLDSKYHWQDVCSDDDGKNLVAAAPNAPLYQSVDSGNTWVPTSSPKKTWKTLVSDSTGQYVSAAASNDGIYSSFDYGKNWMQTSNLQTDWSEITSNENGQYQFAASQDSGIMYSHDSGNSWLKGETEVASWQSITADSTGQFVAACSGDGTIYISENFGVSFAHASTLPLGKTCVSVFTDRLSRDIFIVEFAGNDFLFSVDKGNQWNPLFRKSLFTAPTKAPTKAFDEFFSSKKKAATTTTTKSNALKDLAPESNFLFVFAFCVSGLIFFKMSF
jgi:photosystem II stability/assembly factor-like uncharacterized protein